MVTAAADDAAVARGLAVVAKEGGSTAAVARAAKQAALPHSSPPPAPPPRLPYRNCHACTRRQTTARRCRPWLLATSCPCCHSGSTPPPPQRWSRGARPWRLRTCGNGRPRC
eukprot:scaffold20156_cov43-Phaeocystis_antarctica.AAC.3